MKLVFVHGWGFDRYFWDPLAALLPQFPQSRVDLGFFGAPQDCDDEAPYILIGHSLGFIAGLRELGNFSKSLIHNSLPLAGRVREGGVQQELRVEVRTAAVRHSISRFPANFPRRCPPP